MNNRRRESCSQRLIFGVGLGIAAIIGCGSESPHVTLPEKVTIENSTAAHPAPPSTSKNTGESTQIGSALSITPVDRSSLESTIAKFKGKVVLVDFWATWCLPCVEQLPHTLELGQRLAARGLVVITVSCDEPADAEQVAKFLAAKQADRATNLISQFGGSPKSMEEFEIATGAVPYYKLYDRAGTLQQTFGIKPSAKKQYTAADIAAAVDNLLTK